MLDFIILHPWLLAVLWACMYLFDYGSTLWLVRAYQTTLSRYVVFERGIELNPNFEKEIAAASAAAPRRLPGLSLKFLLALSLVVVIIFLSSWLGFTFVEFLAGALLLLWSYVNARHLRNYFYVWFVRHKPDSLKGRQEQSYWFMQKSLSGEAFVWGLLYIFLFILTWRIFFLAGTLTCWALTLRASLWANRKFKSPALQQDATANNPK